VLTPGLLLLLLLLLLLWNGYKMRERKKKASRKNVDGRSTSSHDSKKFRTRSMEKHGGMAFGFQKTVTAVIKPYRLLLLLIIIVLTYCN
jgi:hypothetical protein